MAVVVDSKDLVDSVVADLMMISSQEDLVVVEDLVNQVGRVSALGISHLTEQRICLMKFLGRVLVEEVGFNNNKNNIDNNNPSSTSNVINNHSSRNGAAILVWAASVDSEEMTTSSGTTILWVACRWGSVEWASEEWAWAEWG